ncbi:MAG TPA: hypothetical protein VGA17_06310 [Nitrospiraceae bacterium]
MIAPAWNRIVVLAAAAACLGLSSSVRAEVPHLVRYQGHAVDANGIPLEGPYTLTLRLYAAEAGGAPVWEETQPGVPLSEGYFDVLIGQVTPLDGLDWTQPLWLAVQINQDPELAPRQRITSVPLALVAEVLAVPPNTSTIQDDANALVPSGAIILWAGAACPAGYARFGALDGKFLVAGTAYNAAAGGSNTHSHGGTTGAHALTTAEMPAHSHGIRGHADAGGQGPNWFPNTSSPVYAQTESAGSGQAHSHTIAAADNRPEFATIMLCQRN